MNYPTTISPSIASDGGSICNESSSDRQKQEHLRVISIHALRTRRKDEMGDIQKERLTNCWTWSRACSYAKNVT